MVERELEERLGEGDAVDDLRDGPPADRDWACAAARADGHYRASSGRAAVLAGLRGALGGHHSASRMTKSFRSFER